MWKQAPQAVQPPEATMNPVAVSQLIDGEGVGKDVGSGGVWVRQMCAPSYATE